MRPESIGQRLLNGGKLRILRPRYRVIVSRVLLGTALYVAVSPVLGLLHETALISMAWSLRVAGELGATSVRLGLLPFDPVYTGTWFYILGDIEVVGLAVGGPFGAALHQLWPAIFAGPDLVEADALLAAVLRPAPSVLARSVAVWVADVSLVCMGLLTIALGQRLDRQRGALRTSLNVSGMILLVNTLVEQIVRQPPSLAEIEASGIAYGISVFFPGEPGSRPRIGPTLAAIPEWTFRLIAIVLLLATAVTSSYGTVFGYRCLRGWVSGQKRTEFPPRPIISFPERVLPRHVIEAVLVFVAALTVAVSPVGNMAEASPSVIEVFEDTTLESFQPDEEWMSPPSLTSSGSSSPLNSHALREGMESARLLTAEPVPSVVTVVGESYKYRYLLNGQPLFIRGMGYNPMYTGKPEAERATLYDRDFSLMRESGVNTILGWSTEEFDLLLLDRAQEHDIGVILPFHLDPDLDYTSPAVREVLTRKVLTWVELYRRHPALRMWGLGNEVLHKLVFPSWLNVRGDPVLEARADAFVDWYVQLIDQAHEMDPNHPVTYREAEEAYLPRLRSALFRDGKRRPWFVYGVNMYTPRLRQMIADWPKMGLDSALFVSEFGPGGSSPADRANGYRELWTMIRGSSDHVIGGAPYVWFTEGPEEVDRVFGLVGPDGVPVDGTLSAIRQLFRSEEASEPPPSSSEVRIPACDAKVAALVTRTITRLQTNPGTPAFEARTPPTIMGPLDNLPAAPVRLSDLRIEQTSHAAREEWLKRSGISREWWAVWLEPGRAGIQLGLLVREHDGQLEISYVYHGPAERIPPTAASC